MPEQYISYAQQRTRARRHTSAPDLSAHFVQSTERWDEIESLDDLEFKRFNQTPATDHRIKGSTGKTMNAQEKVAEGE